MKKRLKTLKTCWAQERLVLPQAQIMALKTATAKRQAAGEIETYQPGYLGSQDTCLVGTTKGARRTYPQTFLETCSAAWAWQSCTLRKPRSPTLTCSMTRLWRSFLRKMSPFCAFS